ncbi:MAG: methylenetetrahydrofolate--tRNA-(uracil(54)-C(5))-methyltransferase (FADH(2)-oxidizing) TrmFO [Clostridia bacterium]|nr:methylenetetrahydrofolate--tRNA-(uracil(54)-C(5))-methyltransferase (FADH(2)-oxidizing) TrmFO [Clostridia bacterium]
MKVRVIGGGLAGAEAAFALLSRGIEVEMCEMRPAKQTPAHKTGGLAELVCSNSLKSEIPTTASGTLKEEMKLFGSIVLIAAEKARVPCGGALGVDRDVFSHEVETILRSFDGFRIVREEVTKIDDTLPTIIATGPLTSEAMARALYEKTGESGLSFYDAAAPIVTAESIDLDHAFFASRYQKGDSDYLNAPMNKEEYLAFYDALMHAERAMQEVGGNYFEGCMPIEVMAEGGVDTIRFGPLRPVGLRHPITGEKYYAVLQLRKENTAGDLYNLVGFQTSLTFPEQRRVFGMIPALKNAEFVRYGVMHRNTFINAPKVIDRTFRMKGETATYIAGQLSGVEGYMESAMSGMIAGVAMAEGLHGRTLPPMPPTTVMGALSAYVSTENQDFQPMNANFGILPPPEEKIRNKAARKEYYAARALRDMKTYIASLPAVEKE